MLYSPWQMSHTAKSWFLSLLPAVLIHKHASSVLSTYLSFLNIAFPQTPLCSARIKCRVDPAIPLPITSRQIRLMLSQLALHTQTHKDPRLRNADLLPRAASRPSRLFFCYFFPLSDTFLSDTRNPNLSSQYTSSTKERKPELEDRACWVLYRKI